MYNASQSEGWKLSFCLLPAIYAQLYSQSKSQDYVYEERTTMIYGKIK